MMLVYIFMCMGMKSLIKEEISLLLEKKVSQLSANIKLSFDLQDTAHSRGRRFRHKDRGVIITNSEITNVVNKVKDDISFYITQGDIKNGSEFVVTGDSDKVISLSLIANEISPYIWELVISTIFSEKGEGTQFRVGRNQLHIKA